MASPGVLSRALNTHNFKKDVVETQKIERNPATILEKAQESLYAARTQFRRLFGSKASSDPTGPIASAAPAQPPSNAPVTPRAENSSNAGSFSERGGRAAGGKVRRGSVTTYTLNLGSAADGQVEREVMRLAGLTPGGGYAFRAAPDMGTAPGASFDDVQELQAARAVAPEAVARQGQTGQGSDGGDGSDSESDYHFQGGGGAGAGAGAGPGGGNSGRFLGAGSGRVRGPAQRERSGKAWDGGLSGVSGSGALSTGALQTLEMQDIQHSGGSIIMGQVAGQPVGLGLMRNRKGGVEGLGVNVSFSARGHGSGGHVSSPGVVGGGGPGDALPHMWSGASSGSRPGTPTGAGGLATRLPDLSPGSRVPSRVPTGHGFASMAAAASPREPSSSPSRHALTHSGAHQHTLSVMRRPSFDQRGTSGDPNAHTQAQQHHPVGLYGSSGTAVGGGTAGGGRWFQQDSEDVAEMLGGAGAEEAMQRAGLGQAPAGSGSRVRRFASIDGDEGCMAASGREGSVLHLPRLQPDDLPERAADRLQELRKYQANLDEHLLRERHALAVGKVRRSSALEEVVGAQQPRWQMTYRGPEAAGAHHGTHLQVDANRRSELDNAHLARMLKDGGPAASVQGGPGQGGKGAGVSAIPVVARARRLSTMAS